MGTGFALDRYVAITTMALGAGIGGARAFIPDHSTDRADDTRVRLGDINPLVIGGFSTMGIAGGALLLAETMPSVSRSARVGLKAAGWMGAALLAAGVVSSMPDSRG